MHGWQESVEPELKPYAIRQNELTTHQGCLLWGIRVIIPLKLPSGILSELHQGHIGVVKMKAVARSYMWWPGIDHDIEHMCKSCVGCQEVKGAPPSAPISPWEWPSRPWQRIHIDFAGPFLDSMFLIAVDAHSKWPEVVPMRTTSSERTIESNTKDRVENLQEKMTERRHTQSRILKVGQKVMIRDYRGERKWLSGTIHSTTGPLSYCVEVLPGVYWRRHIDQIRDANIPVASNIETPLPVLIPKPAVLNVPHNRNNSSSSDGDATKSTNDTICQPEPEATPTVVSKATVPIPMTTTKTDARSQNCESRYPKRASRAPQKFKDYVKY
ncbi:uncharacterized protein [Argopecten irradians]|uniref:uncharacterized protein n=1 Tax=Argopecten irradians TaxID=31199 RepID=UPI0037110395